MKLEGVGEGGRSLTRRRVGSSPSPVGGGVVSSPPAGDLDLDAIANALRSAGYGVRLERGVLDSRLEVRTYLPTGPDVYVVGWYSYEIEREPVLLELVAENLAAGFDSLRSSYPKRSS